jgi:hypothetical protein
MASLPKLNKSDLALAEHAVEFDPPAGSSHFGNSEARWVWHSFERYA